MRSLYHHHLLPPLLILTSILSCAILSSAAAAAAVAVSSFTNSLSKVGFIASSINLNIYDDEGYSPMSSRTNRLHRQRQSCRNKFIISSGPSPALSPSSVMVMAPNSNREKEDCGEDLIHEGIITPHPCDDGDDCGDTPAETKPKTHRKVVRRSSSSSSSSSSGYWIDENDPFVIVMNGDEAFVKGKGDHSAGFTQLPQQQNYSERLIKTNDISSNGKNDNNNNDCIDSSAYQKRVKFTIRGNPRVLIRHRSARGYTYNPSRPAQENFKSCLLKLLPPMMLRPTIQTNATTKSRKSTMVDDDSSFYDDDDGIENNVNHTTNAMDPSTSTPSSPTTVFSKEECLKLSITFRMKRPKSHFTANQPGHGRLKSSAPSKLCIRNLRSDIDNMAKFVMDSLNGLLYVDDRQVVELNVKKVLDCDGLCLGATDVEISGVKDV